MSPTIRLVAVSALAAAASSLVFAAPSRAEDNGLATLESHGTPAATLDKLEAAIKAKGMKIFARVDHSAAAREAGLSMPPATVVVFGNPAGGTPNFLKAPTLAIDLPLKALVWQDAAGKTYVTYNTGRYVFGSLFARHGLASSADVAAAQEELLSGLARAAAD